MHPVSILSPLLGIVFAPLMLGIINRTKAVFAGRRGQPFLQNYFDLWKLFQKGAVYSRTTTWIFRASPIVGLASVLAASLFIPFAGMPGVIAFPGDLFVFVYFLALMRFFTVLGALDTGSSFEGMGASREVQFSALAEPALLLALAVFGCKTVNASLSGIAESLSFWYWLESGPALLMAAAALMVVLLAENARVPVDDPTTHLELTMIHEVMVLDHGGPDLGFILYGAALKLWVFSALLIDMVFPVHTGRLAFDIFLALLGQAAVAVAIGIGESTRARLRLLVVPNLLAGAVVLSAVALILVLR
jgi:formate hydrogenlyase subunit 4